jgi:anti-sigma B factor antagonist
MQITTEETDKFTLVKIAGDVDAASSLHLDKVLQKSVSQQPIKHILVDGSQLNYISSAGLGVFMSYIKEFEEKHIVFALYGLSPKVKNVFEILGLHSLLQIVATKSEAELLLP